MLVPILEIHTNGSNVHLWCVLWVVYILAGMGKQIDQGATSIIRTTGGLDTI